MELRMWGSEEGGIGGKISRWKVLIVCKKMDGSVASVVSIRHKEK